MSEVVNADRAPSPRELPMLDVPVRIRSVVYLVGMLGFPIVVSAYVLISLATGLQNVEERITQLATRIDERPMGLDRSTDFVIYLTTSLGSELKAGVPKLADNLDFELPNEEAGVVRAINRVNRQVESYTRPVVRRHARFAARFPSVGGNLSSLFVLAAPSEDLSEGDSEAYLSGSLGKDFAESLVALIMNNIAEFGHPSLMELAGRDRRKDDVLTQLFGQSAVTVPELGPDGGASEPTVIEEAASIVMIESDLFVELTNGAIDTAVIALRDQMLERVRLQSSDFQD